MKIVLWIADESNQKALCSKINELYPLAGVVLEQRIVKRKMNTSLLSKKFIERLFLPKARRSWFKLLNFYDKKFKHYPKTNLITVSNVNSKETFEFTNKIQPDLVLVSGTSLVKEPLLSITCKIGILNLHTGLSPYVKGGPNCTNWCIANRDFHLIGNTIMWIDNGIDTGNIFTTKLVKFSGKEKNLFSVHLSVMEDAHELYISAVNSINKGYIQSIKQSEITQGTTYYSKQWGLKQLFQLTLNTSIFVNSFKKPTIRTQNIITCRLPNDHDN
tara:strand:- start:1060 stop:1878 length:819 start_codon:yes stop_codon:yes gene_type:complete